MSAPQIAGIVMLVLPMVGFFVWLAIEFGLRPTLAYFGFCAGMTLWLVAARYLMERGL